MFEREIKSLLSLKSTTQLKMKIHFKTKNVLSKMIALVILYCDL